MNRAYWERIQQQYPQALACCIKAFQTSSPRWRRDIQQADQLISFFNHHNIRLVITKTRGRYGYELRSSCTVVKCIAKWAERPNALWWGIDLAFYTLQQRYVGQFYHPPVEPPSLGIIGERRAYRNGDGPNWGERMRKAQEEEQD